MSEDVNELQKEWRAIVLAKLTTLEANQAELRKDMADVKTSFAQTSELQLLRTEVDKLKEFKAKTLGMIIAFNSIAVVIGWFIQNIIKHSQ